MAARLHLVRHGHTGALGNTLTGRSPGVGLSERGVAEVARTALGLSAERIAAVFSSPQPRAAQTAETIANVVGCAVETEERLDEVDFGAWSGQGFAELDALPGWSEWNAVRSLAPTPRGETMLQVQVRAVGFVQHLRERRQSENFVLVSHADVIKSILAYLLGMPVDLMQRLEVFPGGRSVVVLDGRDVRVEAMNLLAPQ